MPLLELANTFWDIGMDDENCVRPAQLVDS
jgi:hypothetical protein